MEIPYQAAAARRRHFSGGRPSLQNRAVEVARHPANRRPAGAGAILPAHAASRMRNAPGARGANSGVWVRSSRWRLVGWELPT